MLSFILERLQQRYGSALCCSLQDNQLLVACGPTTLLPLATFLKTDDDLLFTELLNCFTLQLGQTPITILGQFVLEHNKLLSNHDCLLFYILHSQKLQLALTIIVPYNQGETLFSLAHLWPEATMLENEPAELEQLSIATKQRHFPLLAQKEAACAAWNNINCLNNRLLPPCTLHCLLHNQLIKEAELEFGYTQRGLEQLCQKRDLAQIATLLTSLGPYSGQAAQAALLALIEQNNKLEIPGGAVLLRSLLLELGSLAYQLLTAANLLALTGLNKAAVNLARSEELLNASLAAVKPAAILGHYWRPGGFACPPDPQWLQTISQTLSTVRKFYDETAASVSNNYSLKNRLAGSTYQRLLTILTAGDQHLSTCSEMAGALSPYDQFGLKNSQQLWNEMTFSSNVFTTAVSGPSGPLTMNIITSGQQICRLSLRFASFFKIMPAEQALRGTLLDDAALVIASFGLLANEIDR